MKEELSERVGIPLLKNFERIKDSVDQTETETTEERIENVKGCFSYKGKILVLQNNLLTAYNSNGNKEYTYKAKLELSTGGNYGYTFRVMPTNEMLLDSENLDLVKWITK